MISSIHICMGGSFSPHYTVYDFTKPVKTQSITMENNNEKLDQFELSFVFILSVGVLC